VGVVSTVYAYDWVEDCSYTTSLLDYFYSNISVLSLCMNLMSFYVMEIYVFACFACYVCVCN
jgi:hypothetical protein